MYPRRVVPEAIKRWHRSSSNSCWFLGKYIYIYTVYDRVLCDDDEIRRGQNRVLASLVTFTSEVRDVVAEAAVTHVEYCMNLF